MFKISTNGVLTGFYSFTGGIDGANPPARFVQGGDGSCYGTTYGGNGATGGTVFRLTIVPEAPVMTILPSNRNLVLTWPTNATGFVLQSTTNLASPVWTTNSAAPVVLNGQNTVTNLISGTPQFFRLSQ